MTTAPTTAYRCVVAGAAVAAGLLMIPACSPTVSGCGRDLAGLHSAVLGVRADSGAVAWRRDDVPLAAAGMTQLVDGKIRLVLEPNKGQLLLDPTTGHSLEERPPGTYPISVPPPVRDTAPADTGSPVTPLPERPVVDGATSYVVSAGALVATDRATQHQRWNVPLPATQPAHSFPIPVGDLVVISTSDAAPGCA